MKAKAITKQPNIWGIYFLALLLLLTQSCVSEDELDLPPDEDETEALSESVAIISTLRAIKSNSLTKDGCIQFLFPLELEFNNEIQITISDFDGLNEVATNVTVGQHIDAIEFPFTVSKNDIIKNIQDEQDFVDLLDDCGILTLRDEFDPFFIQCFDLVYPVTMLDIDSNQVVIDNKDEYFAFERDQGFDKQPKFVYPIELFDYANESNISIETPFQLFEVFDTCDTCPELFFTIDTLKVNKFLFEASFDRIDNISYGWYIDDEKVEEDGGNNQGDNLLIETFPSGEYEICIRTALPDGDCFTGTEFCRTITVDACPFVSFLTEEINANTYEFIANFDKKDLIDYHWNIYQNDDLVFSEFEDSDGDDKLIYQFEQGEWEVCLQAEVDGCPELLSSCTVVVVE